MKYVMFVCTDNKILSPIAQGICEKLSFDKRLPVRCDSSGLRAEAAQPVSEMAVSVCKEIGVDISRYRTADVRTYDLSDYDAVFTLNMRNKSALIALGANPYKVTILETEDGPIVAPRSDDLDDFRRCRDEILTAVENAIIEI